MAAITIKTERLHCHLMYISLNVAQTI